MVPLNTDGGPVKVVSGLTLIPTITFDSNESETARKKVKKKNSAEFSNAVNQYAALGEKMRKVNKNTVSSGALHMDRIDELQETKHDEDLDSEKLD